MSEVTKPRVVTARDRLDAMTPAERLAALRRLQKIQKGLIQVPARCGHCRSPSIAQDPDEASKVLCVACGIKSTIRGVHRARQLEIEAIIVDGEP